jgi:hypothetical protein
MENEVLEENVEMEEIVATAEEAKEVVDDSKKDVAHLEEPVKPEIKEDDTEGIFFLLGGENNEEIVGIVDSKTDDANCVLSPLENIDYTVLGKLFVNGKIEDKPLSEEEMKEESLSKLQTLCDKKSVEAKTYINGGYVSAEQLARYEEKLKMAQAFLTDGSYESVLALEAEIQGVSVEDLAKAIVAKGAAYENALLSFNAKIEAFRVSVNKIIEQKQFETANAIIEKAYALGAGATDADIKALFE